MENPTNQTEAITNLALQSFEEQLRLLNSLGKHPDRKQHIENLHQSIVSLSEAVENSKVYLLDGIERIANASVNEFSSIGRLLDKLAEASGDPYAKEYAHQLHQVEKTSLHTIGLAEANIGHALIKSFNAMQGRIKILLSKVEALEH